jgi:colanic acid biosynthesis glycosyl transferase WcaI
VHPTAAHPLDGPPHAVTAGDPAPSRGIAVRRRRRTSLRRRNLLVIGPYDAADRGGAGAHTSGIADHLSGVAASVCVIPTPCGPAGMRVRSLTSGLPHPPDAVIGVLPGLTGATTAARLARRHRVPLVLVVHDLLSARTGGTRSRGVTIAEAAEQRLLRAADKIAVSVPELTARLDGAGIAMENVHLLPHWAPAASQCPVACSDVVSARLALGWATRPFTVVATGRDSDTDLPTIRACAALLPPEDSFAVLGNGSRKGKSRGRWVSVADRSPGRIRSLGSLDDATYRLALSAADVILLTERPDAPRLVLPGVLAHCLAAGRPVVAGADPNGPVAGELRRAGNAGIVVRPGQPDLLADAVRSLRPDAERRRAMGRAASRHAVEGLGRGATMRQLEAMLLSALGDVVIGLVHR